METEREEFDSATGQQRPRRWWYRWFILPARRHPVIALFLLALLSNALGTAFNFLYNVFLINEGFMNEAQQEVFWHTAKIYNSIVWPMCLGLVLYIFWPLRIANQMLARGLQPPADLLNQCRRVLITWPVNQIWVNALGWFPGAIVFPASIYVFGGPEHAMDIWWRFILSFLVAGLLTIVTTIFIMEEFLIRVLYPVYFSEMRPADVEGPRIPFHLRLIMLYAAVAAMPLLAVGVVAAELEPRLSIIILSTIGISILFGGIICGFVGNGVLRWMRAHRHATERISRGNFSEPIAESRPDEWGRLTDRVNDMMMALGLAEQMRETFGQVVHPNVRDAIMQRYQGLVVDEAEMTVLFADIRGFTRRSAGEIPEKVVELLNRFLTLSVSAIEENGGLVNKFLGDGVMALFNTPPLPLPDHADRAIQAAQTLLARLTVLNADLNRVGEDSLKIGIGIHTGLALAGCVGAALVGDSKQMRREFTAIGETVNLAQRMEQLTKTLGGPILLSGRTQEKLAGTFVLNPLGLQDIPGYSGQLEVYQLCWDEQSILEQSFSSASPQDRPL